MVVFTGCLATPGEAPPVGEPDERIVDLPDTVSLGPERVCLSSMAGRDRFTPVDAFGIDQSEAPVLPSPTGGGNVIEDLDGDGDLDVLIGWGRDAPRVFENEGGVFTEAPALDLGLPGMGGFFTVADLDGDRLPELLTFGEGRAVLHWNLADLTWGDSQTVRDSLPDDPERAQIQTAIFGDVDGDGDLDILLPVVHVGHPGGGQPAGGFDLLLINDDNTFTLDRELSPGGIPGHAQVATFTDRDRDGDLDILVPSEFGTTSEPTAFYRNDPGAFGSLLLTNDAWLIGAGIRVSGMGLDSADLNGDGFLDYCIAQFGPVACLASVGSPPEYVRYDVAVGLSHPEVFGNPSWSAYGMELADLDHDGFVEVVVAAGPPTRESPTDYPDGLWWGGPQGFEDATEELGFGDSRRHFSVVTADLDDDGWLDIVRTGNEGEPVVWMNHCGDDGWIEFEFEGLPGNSLGYGVQVGIQVNGENQVREVSNSRALSQGPARVRFGLGDADGVDGVHLIWPDGTAQQFGFVPGRRRVTVGHPDLP